MLTLFEQTGFVAVLIAGITALSTLAAGVLLQIVLGYQRRAERRERARTQEMRSQLDVLYKPLMRVLEVLSPPVPDADQEDWDRIVGSRISEAVKIIDEHIEYAGDELKKLLYSYAEGRLYNDLARVDDLERLYRHVKDEFDRLRRELYMMPRESRPSLLARLRRRVVW